MKEVMEATELEEGVMGPYEKVLGVGGADQGDFLKEKIFN